MSGGFTALPRPVSVESGGSIGTPLAFGTDIALPAGLAVLADSEASLIPFGDLLIGHGALVAVGAGETFLQVDLPTEIRLVVAPSGLNQTVPLYNAGGSATYLGVCFAWDAGFGFTRFNPVTGAAVAFADADQITLDDLLFIRDTTA